MHFHCEIVIPPSDDVESAVTQVMEPFNERADDGNRSSYPFWDWYVIGGRWGGAKMEAAIGYERIKEFREELRAREFTISGLQAGKPSLNPDYQCELVDALWSERFPEHAGPCPLFAHSNNNRSTLPGDITSLASCPLSLTASRVIIAGPAYVGDGLRPVFMASGEIFNGCNYEHTTWDKTLGGALTLHRKRLERYTPDARAKVDPSPNWLVVTVDYHS